MERQFQDAISIVIAYFTVGLGNSQRAVRVLAPSADHEFANAVLQICFPIGVLRGKALIVVIMAANDNFDSRMV